MVTLQTFPPKDVLDDCAAATPDFMRPNHVPFAVIATGLIDPSRCEEIAAICDQFEGYQYGHCDALTREIGHIPELDDIRDITHNINDLFFGYDLDTQSHSWMQTYGVGDGYAMHTDGEAGRTRKLTSVTMLSDPAEYSGGQLEIFAHPHSVVVSKVQGTLVVFAPWLLHQVHPVTLGSRQTINMGFHGPNFR